MTTKRTLGAGLSLAMTAGLLVPMAVAPATAADAYPLTPEQATAPLNIADPTGRVNFQVSVASDGTGHGTSAASLITKANGFEGITDESPNDGVVSIKDRVIYDFAYNIKPSDTETRVRFSPRFQIQNEAGQLIQADQPALDLASFRSFCEGGTGYVHTGTVVGSGGNMSCDMVFPASNTSSATDGAWVQSAPVFDRILDGFLHTKIEVTSSGSTVSGELPHRTRIIGATTMDPTLIMEKQRVEFQDGRAFYVTDVHLGLTAFGQLKGTGSHDSLRFDVNGAIDFGELPEGSVLTPNREGMVVEGTSVRLSDVEVFNSIQNHPSARPSVNIRIPADTVEFDDAGQLVISPHITEMTMQHRPTRTNEMVATYPLGFMADGISPGLNQPSGHNTLTHVNGVAVAHTGTHGYANNDWVKIVLEGLPTGIWEKALVTDDAGEPTATGTGGNRTNVAVEQKPVGYDYWARFQLRPFAGTQSSATYCDVWDQRYQKVDTDRTVRAVQWDLASSTYVSVPLKIQYATTANPTALIGNETNRNAAHQQVCGADSTLAWSDVPSDETNVMRVTIEGDHNAAATPTVDTHQGAIHSVHVPFTTTGEENFKPYPQGTRLSDSAIFSNAGQFSDSRDTEHISVSKTGVEIGAPTPGGTTHNAGSTGIIPLGGTNSDNFLVPGDSIQYQPQWRATIDSAYSSLQFNEKFLQSYRITNIIDADFGPDGLPGTDDDVSDWIVEFEDAKPLVGKGTGSHAIIRTDTPNDANILGTLPGYIPQGQKLDVSMEYINPEELPADDRSNNYKEGQITVAAASTVTQSKWVLTPREMVGETIGWGIAWSNGSQTAQGPAQFVDILPYNGDGRGTEISGQLSDVQFHLLDVDEDVRIEVTDADPRTINADSVKDGTIKFVHLEDQDALEGEVTAFRITEDSIAPGAMGHIEVTASTEWLAEDDRISNNLGEATVTSLSLPVPQTVPVHTVLYTTVISGTVFYDTDKDGVMDESETGRITGSTVELVMIEEDGTEFIWGDAITTGEDGTYLFGEVPLGEYLVRITTPGGNVQESWVITTPERTPTLTSFNPKATDQDFGFWGEPESTSIQVVKSVDGLEDGATVTSGDEHTFRFKVTNTGGTPLEGIRLNDDVLGEIQCEIPTLAPGESHECTVTSTINPTA